MFTNALSHHELSKGYLFISILRIINEQTNKEWLTRTKSNFKKKYFPANNCLGEAHTQNKLKTKNIKTKFPKVQIFLHLLQIKTTANDWRFSSNNWCATTQLHHLLYYKQNSTRRFSSGFHVKEIESKEKNKSHTSNRNPERNCKLFEHRNTGLDFVKQRFSDIF